MGGGRLHAINATCYVALMRCTLQNYYYYVFKFSKVHIFVTSSRVISMLFLQQNNILFQSNVLLFNKNKSSSSPNDPQYFGSLDLGHLAQLVDQLIDGSNQLIDS